MHPVLAFHPELHPLRPQHISLPPLRPLNVSRSLPHQLPRHLHQHLPALQRLTLPRYRRHHLTPPRSAMKVSIYLSIRQLRHHPLHPNLPPQTLPVKAHRSSWILSQLPTLAALSIRIKRKSPLVHTLHQHHPHTGSAVSRRRSQSNSSRIVRLRSLRIFHPHLEQRNRIYSRLDLSFVHHHPSLQRGIKSVLPK